MSNALAIAGVTAVLEYCFNQVYQSPGSALSGVTISALAPDIIQASITAAAGPQLQVNLFMHQVTPNAAWRNVGMPSLGPDGSTRLANQPLALDLHYLLTAYSNDEMIAEALLGYAVMMLHENPILPRALIQTALNGVPHTNPLWSFMATTGLADQIEMIKITPSVLGREEMAWLWTALKADYRPTFPFQVSVVLIEPSTPFSFALPVLRRNITVQPGPPPQLLTVSAPIHQSASAPGDVVTLTGETLANASLVVLSNPKLGINYPPFAPATVGDTTVTFKVPDDPANFPAGVYNLSLRFLDTGGNVTASTNILPLLVAPVVLPFTAGAAVANALGTMVTLKCKPNVWPSQSASLALAGTAEPLSTTLTASSGTLTFQFPKLAPGQYLAQMQVDGVSSQIGVQWTPWPPVFTGTKLTV